MPSIQQVLNNGLIKNLSTCDISRTSLRGLSTIPTIKVFPRGWGVGNDLASFFIFMGIQGMEMEDFFLCSRGFKSQWTEGGEFGEMGNSSHSPETVWCWWWRVYPINPIGQMDNRRPRKEKPFFLTSSIPTAVMADAGASPASLSQLSQVQLSCPERRWMETGRLQGTLPCSWSVGFYSHHWAQENVFKWPSPVHTRTPWSDWLGGKRALRILTASLSLSPGRATLWDHRTWACTVPPLAGQWRERCAPRWGHCSSDPAQKPGAAGSTPGPGPHSYSFLKTKCWWDQRAGSHFLILGMDLLFHDW